MRWGKTFVQNISITAIDKAGRCVEREQEVVDKCYICFNKFGHVGLVADNDLKNKKVRGHYHYMGLYQGAAHNNYNLKNRIPDYNLIVFHM